MEKQKKFSRNKQEKINSIYSTFYRLLNEIGYNRTTTNLVAEVSKVSIGTIYRYFPDGKSSIMKGTLEHTSNKIFDIDDFNSMNEDNLPEKLESLIRKHLRVHRENFQYHLAVNQAILSNKDLFVDYGNNINQLFEIIADEIREKNLFFQNVPRSHLIDTLLVVFNTLEAFIHRHMFITLIFPTDEELVQFLKKVLLVIIVPNN
ncbi:MAG: TetR/AcrR family transcriptional regulator [Candidatus Hodarchaeota archaeon]